MTATTTRDDALPSLVRRHAERAVPTGVAPLQVRLTQEGEMWMKPGSHALRFTATQELAVDRVGFSWRARFPLLGPLALRVTDEYVDDAGALELRLLGIPVQRQRGPETTAGEALRYLAELAWVPFAFVANRQLEWRELDEGRVEVATRVGSERLAVEFAFDEAGDIVHASAAQRMRRVGKACVATPWVCTLGAYEVVGGIRIPTLGEAYWDLAEGRHVYWRGRVLSAQLLDEPFGARDSNTQAGSRPRSSARLRNS